MNKGVQAIKKAIPFDEAVELLKKLVSVNTVNPPGNEINLKPVVEKAFKDLGMKVEIVEGKKGRASFIGKIGSGTPSIGFFPHFDVVPAGDGWVTDPFTPVIKNGKMYGRGTEDSKGNFASSWAAIKAFLALHKKFKGTIYLLGCADEEMGSTWGVHYLLEKGFRVDYAIVPDGGYIDKIIVGEKGAIRLKIKSYGKQAHGSTPHHGINAVENLIDFLQKIREIDLEKFSYNKLFSPVSRNIGTIKGGHAVNIVPAYAEAEIDFRLPIGVEKEHILERIHEEEKKLTKQNKNVKIEIEESLSVKPHITQKDSPLIKAFLKKKKKAGIKMRIGTMGGITDAKPLSLAGISTLVHSMDDGNDVAHNANEYIKLENLKTAALLYTLTLEKLLLEK